MSYKNYPNPRLPMDIERMIFELAVSEQGAKASTPLMLVAKRVREWIIPLIYRVVNQIWLPSPNFANLPHLRQSAGPSVQHLMIDEASADGSLITILSSCPNVCNLAIYLPTSWEEGELDSLLPNLEKMTRLTRLRAGLSCVCYAELLIQPFLNLTHLEILLSSGRSWGEWEALTHLPKLTHINVECIIQVNDVLRLLKDCRRLILLIVVSDRHSPQNMDALSRVDDNRLVLLGRLNYVDSIIDWEKGANGGVDTWVFAELVVLARDREYFLTPLAKGKISRVFDWKNLTDNGREWFSGLRLN